jgi:DNA-directed RNA polymerase subunit K
MEKENLTKYEKARIIGARALQISMGAPLLIDRKEEINTIDLAKKEYEAGVLPMSIKRIMPEKREVL